MIKKLYANKINIYLYFLVSLGNNFFQQY